MIYCMIMLMIMPRRHIYAINILHNYCLSVRPEENRIESLFPLKKNINTFTNIDVINTFILQKFKQNTFVDKILF